MSEMREAIERFVKPLIPTQVVLGTIISVDETARTCKVAIDGRPDRLSVRMRSVIDQSETGILIKPTVDSYVLVGLIDNMPNQSFIISYSEVDEIKWMVPQLQLNGDALGGIVDWPSAVEQLEKLSARVDTIYDAFDNAVVSPPSPPDSGASLLASIKGLLNPGKVDIEDWSNLENTNVTHG